MSREFDPHLKERVQKIIPLLRESFDPNSEFSRWRDANSDLPEIRSINFVSELFQKEMQVILGPISEQPWAIQEFLHENEEWIAGFCADYIDYFEACQTAYYHNRLGVQKKAD